MQRITNEILDARFEFWLKAFGYKRADGFKPGLDRSGTYMISHGSNNVVTVVRMSGTSGEATPFNWMTKQELSMCLMFAVNSVGEKSHAKKK